MRILNPIVSGSLLVTGSSTITGVVSASSFIGDGSGLTGVTSYTDSDTLTYINSLGIVSGSSQIAYTNLQDIPSGIVSSSTQLADITIPGDLTISGILTAREFHTEFVSASIVFQSGSTQFGNSLDDTHSFIGTISATTIQNVISSSAQVDYASIQNKPTIPTNNNQLTNGAGYCTTDTNTTYTANEMLTCIKTVDGVGSGLDADALDGQQGSYYLDYNNFTNKPTIPTNNNQLTNGAGYTTCTGTLTGAGTSGYIPKWNGSTSQTNSIIYDNGTNVGIGITSPAEKLHIVGNIVATGDVTAYYSSDERLKENKEVIQNPLDKIDKISGYTFDWKKTPSFGVPKNDVGVIAQEIEEILPQIVTDREDGYKAVRYEKIIPLLIESIKELSNNRKQDQKRIDYLEKIIKDNGFTK